MTLIRDKRKRLGLSQQDVALKLGINRAYLSMLENGERRPSVETAKKLGDFFGLEWTIFFDNQCNELKHL